MVINSNIVDKLVLLRNRNGKEMVAKKFLGSFYDCMYAKQTLKEILIHLELIHPSIARIVGIYSTIINNIETPIILLGDQAKSTLSSIINSAENDPTRNGLDNTSKMKYLYGIAKAMQYLHSKGIVYRNMSLNNILVDSKYQPFLTGFEFADHLDDIDKNDERSIGNIMFQSPEAIVKRNYGFASDVYSYGILAYMIVMEKKIIFDDNVEYFKYYQYMSKFNQYSTRNQIYNARESSFEQQIILLSNKIDAISEKCKKLEIQNSKLENQNKILMNFMTEQFERLNTKLDSQIDQF